jgi:CheY-like chemotaxis protein
MLAIDMIRDAGFEPLRASNADEAISILENRDDIRIVFTDINMPGSMDGIKLTQAVRHRWPSVKIIVTSGISGSELKLFQRAAGLSRSPMTRVRYPTPSTVLRPESRILRRPTWCRSRLSLPFHSLTSSAGLQAQALARPRRAAVERSSDAILFPRAKDPSDRFVEIAECVGLDLSLESGGLF